MGVGLKPALRSTGEARPADQPAEPGQPGTTPPSGRAGWLYAPRWPRKPDLLLLGAVTTASTIATHMIVPALPDAAADLGTTRATIQMTVTLYLVGLAIGQLVYGPLSDRFGRRPILMLGLAIYNIASLAAAFAPNVWVLLAARVLQSLGGCAGIALGRAIVRDSSTPEKAAGSLAMLTLLMSTVPALAPAIGGYVAVAAGWRAVFALLAAIGVATLVAIFFVFPETRRAHAGGSGAGTMIVNYVRLLRSPQFCGYALGGACSTTSYYAFLAASPFLFIEVMHRPPQDVGLCNLLLLLGAALGSIGASRFARRLPFDRAARLTNWLTVLGAALLFAVHFAGMTGFVPVVGALLVFMLGVGATSPFAVAGSLSVHPDAAGTASGLHGCVQMGYGALCSVAASLWHEPSVIPVATIMLGSALLGQVSLTVAARAGRKASLPLARG